MTNVSERWAQRGRDEPFRKAGHARTVLHSSASNEAYTPPHYLQAASYVLGGIDLDPASCAIANEEVRARRFFTKEDDGLHKPWCNMDASPATVWLNPPGGFLDPKTLKPATRGMSSACAWWYTAIDRYRLGQVKAALYYCFRLDVLQNIQEEEDYPPPQAFPFCIFGERPRHWSKDTPRELRGHRGQPTHACGVFFLPELEGPGYNSPTPMGWVRSASLERFREAFSPFGYVRI